MTQARKIIKVNDGDAFIEIGESYIRIGVGTQVFLELNESTINGGGKGFNLQMEPDKVTYQGVLKNIGPIAGMLPFGPKYDLNFEAFSGLTNAAASMTGIMAATSIGVLR